MALNIFASICFALAVVQTFFAQRIRHIAQRFPQGSVGENFFHLFGEVEIVFGFWAALYLIVASFLQGTAATISYLNNTRFTEPIFVFAVMVVCATRPVLESARSLIQAFARVLPFPQQARFLFSLLAFGPLLGSFITEPAAMTVCAFLLAEFFSTNPKLSHKLKYALIGLLFVNVSIGGTLTAFAAPPVLMVAYKWNWDMAFMFMHFGWKAILACAVSTAALLFFFRQELADTILPRKKTSSPLLLQGLHLLFLLVVVLGSHHEVLVLGFFCFFLGLVTVTKEYQEEIRLRESLLVAFFLAGLVVLGTPQSWWLGPLLGKLSTSVLYLGSAALTAITDNAALTFLGSQSGQLDEFGRYALVAGSVVGGGLTVIANAPNPIGYGLLSQFLGEDGFSALGLFLGALFPTLVALSIFWFL